jgi:hypothetical protein
MPTDDRKRSGRVVFDSRGQASWEWEIATGVFSAEPDTESVPAIGSEGVLSLEDSPATDPTAAAKVLVSGDPRNWRPDTGPGRSVPRKSLDDLRRLSEEIKRSRQWPPAAKSKKPADR